MIIIINGSLGVGKSSVSEELLLRMKNSVLLDGDHLGNVNPFEIYDQKRISHLYQTIQLLVAFHEKNGFENFVINYVFESSDSLKQLQTGLSNTAGPIFTYWLTSNQEEQENRIRKRGRSRLDWELKRFVELQNIQRKESESGWIGKAIDTSTLSVSDVADMILEDINPSP